MTTLPSSPSIMSTSKTGKIVSVLREEATVPQVRLWWANLLGRLVPSGAGARLRAALYRALGVQVGVGTVFLGPVTFKAARGMHPQITFGARCFLNELVYIDASAPVTLGDGVSLGHHVVIITADHAVGPPAFRAGDLRPAPVRIGDGAWIAAGAMILPGVTIGAGAIVAAGAVVTRDVPPNTLVGGVPARPIREIPE